MWRNQQRSVDKIRFRFFAVRFVDFILQDTLAADNAKTSDRELARIVVEMFAGTGLSVVVAFGDSQQAAKASKKWEGSFDGRVIVLDEKSKKKE